MQVPECVEFSQNSTAIPRVSWFSEFPNSGPRAGVEVFNYLVSDIRESYIWAPNQTPFSPRGRSPDAKVEGLLDAISYLTYAKVIFLRQSHRKLAYAIFPYLKHARVNKCQSTWSEKR